ncbi:MAG: leucine-rich repeat domain-containing protein [Clostridium sp.]|nr:leucine-rich repeat domain-containing protein [Clostridium sp.]MBQ9000143.1 leucine-rich repeat domain-containing protein [Clostridium sp.]
MKNNKKYIAKGIIIATTMANMPINSLANTIDNYKTENTLNNNIKKDFTRILSAKEKQVSNRSVIQGKECVITLSEGQNVPENLRHNPDGYEIIKVITTGDKKLDETDFTRLRLSLIPKIDLSQAKADSIPNNAFKSSTLSEFKFPQGVTSIGDYAFHECRGFIGDLVIPDSVVSTGEWSFSNSEFTGNLILGDSIESIGEFSFYNCYDFRGDLIIPDSLITVGDYAFYNTGFETLRLGNSVTTIGNHAFAESWNLTGDLIIPDSVTTIGEEAFFLEYI